MNKKPPFRIWDEKEKRYLDYDEMHGFAVDCEGNVWYIDEVTDDPWKNLKVVWNEQSS